MLNLKRKSIMSKAWELNADLKTSILSALIFFSASVYLMLDSQNALGLWQNFNILDNYKIIISKGGQGDEAGFINQARVWSSDSISRDNSGILGLWPPGIILFHFMFIKILGHTYMPLLILGFINITIMTFTVFFSTHFVSVKWKNLNLLKKLALLLGFSYFFYEWNGFFLKNAILLTEGISTSLFALYLSLLLYSCHKKNFGYEKTNNKLIKLVAMSMLLIAAQYTRQIYGLIVDLAFVSFVVFLTYNKLIHSKSIKELAKAYGMVIIPVGIAFIAAIPYKTLQYYSTNSFAMTATTSYVWGQRWTPSDYLIAQGGEWLVRGGANLPCKLEPELCQTIFEKELATNLPYQNSQFFKEYKSLAIRSIFENPVKWGTVKFQLLYDYWTAASSGPGSPSTINRWKILGLIVILIILLKLIFKTLTSTRFLQLTSILGVCMIAALIGPQFLLHFEVRYFLPLKLFIFHLMLIGFYVDR
jgi:hypothetical protein